MAFDIQISPGSPAPIYQQIVDQVCHAITTGALSTGDRLPSVRALAERIVVNPNTVARAYTDLVNLGVVAAHRGKGLFVEPKRQIYSDEERARRLDIALETFLQQVQLLNFTPEEIAEQMHLKFIERVID